MNARDIQNNGAFAALNTDGSVVTWVMSHVLDGGEVCWRVIGSDPALVIAENHVHDPVQAVFDRPMAAHNRPEERRYHDQ